MEYLRTIAIFIIVKFINTVKWIEYQILCLFSHQVEIQMTAQMKAWGVEFNGDKHWDIQVHNPKFYPRAAAYGTLGMGQSYIDGWWDCEQLDVMITKISRNGGAVAFINNPYNKFLNYLRWNTLNLQTQLKATEVRDQHYDGIGECVPWLNFYSSNP